MRPDDNKPPFLIEVAIQPKLEAERDRLLAALAQFAAEDPKFGFATDAESGQIILKGMGELHLDIKVDILKRTDKATSMLAHHRWPTVKP